MSIESWKAEFYPIPVGSPEYEAHMRDHAHTDRDRRAAAIAHSLHKWKGLLHAAMKKHGMMRRDVILYDEEERRYFYVDCATCSLCKEFRTDHGTNCSECPLYLETGARCGEEPFAAEPFAADPYYVWSMTGDARPMVRALERALAKVERA